MGITCKNLLCSAVLVAGTALVTTTVVSQDLGGEMPSQEEMMKMWMELAEPGPEHKKLQESAGSWSHKATSYWGGPDAPPSESSSTSTIKPILGGRFMLEKVHGEMDMGGEPMPFEGLGIYGYDKAQKKHVFVWMDTMGTMIMSGEGTADETGDVITYFSEMHDPVMNSTARLKSVAKRHDTDHSTYAMFRQMPDGSWHKEFEMKSTRQD